MLQTLVVFGHHSQIQHTRQVPDMADTTGV